METLETLETLKAEVEALKAENAMLTARLAKRTHHNIESLKAYDAANPGKAAARSKKHKETHREEYNARRRELYRQKKEARASTAAVAGASVASDAPY